MTSQEEIEYLKSGLDWTSGNEKIDKFIQERQLNTNFYNDVVFEWIPYNQFNEIKETGKNGSITVYSAIWRNGPLYYNKYTRDSNKEVALKCLHNLQNPVDFLINEATKYSTTNAKLLVLYGISQNPDTNDYILVFSNENFGKDCIICDEIYTDIQYKWCKPCNFISWKSGDDKIDSLIQLKINERSDTRFEWIPFNQFNKIRKIGKGMFVSIYAAIWEYEVTLLCYNDSQKLLDKVEEFDSSCKIYGLSQNSDKKDYILALQKEYCMEYGKKYCKNCGVKFTQIRYLWCKPCTNIFTKWTVENEKIDDLIQEMKLRTNSSIWKDGPLKYDIQ
uniref:Protein kinase domain-containing protein n=1 Tax=Rhizophagus irregularis (strain DAOM 181602 / DAOM 197198 / MUCL 43194) TaxID=747089 RepID=U9T5F0_RHIID